MQSSNEATTLISLDDAELDAVAGGCGHRGRHHGRPDWMRRLGGGKFGDIDIDINIVNVVGNVVEAGGNLTIAITQSN